MFHPHRISPRAPGTTRREGPVATFRMFKIFQEFVPRLFVSSKSVFRIGNGPFRKSSGIGGSYSVPKKAEARFPKSFHQLQDVCVCPGTCARARSSRSPQTAKLNSRRLASFAIQHNILARASATPSPRIESRITSCTLSMAARGATCTTNFGGITHQGPPGLRFSLAKRCHSDLRKSTGSSQ